MKNKLQFFGAAILCLCAIVSRSQTARNYADKLVNSTNVSNPERAADTDLNNYALMQTSIGVDSSASLKLRWSQLGSAGEIVVVEFQNNDGGLSLDVLQSLTMTLFDSDNKQIANQNKLAFADVTAVAGTSRYRTTFRPGNGALDIKSIRIKISGMANVENRIRIYSASLREPCFPIRGDSIYAQRNTSNVSRAVTADPNDYATLEPTVAFDNSRLDVAFSETVPGGHVVEFRLGEGNPVLSAELLQNITLIVFDTNGGIVVSHTGFALADARVLDGGRFNLDVSTPSGSYQVARGRISLTALNVLTTLKVYDIVARQPCNGQPVAVNNPPRQAITNLQVYPNPFNAYTTLDFKGVLNSSYHITITDKTGAVVEERTFTGTGSVKVLEKAQVGIYFVKISSGNMIETRKVIKL